MTRKEMDARLPRNLKGLPVDGRCPCVPCGSARRVLGIRRQKAGAR